MKKNIKKLLIIFILIISYIIINLICGNSAFATTETASTLATTQTITQKISTDIKSIDSNKYPQIKEMLQSLQKEHPNWKFKILYTDIEWAEVIANEYVGHGASPRNLVPANNANYDKEWICKACGAEKVYDSGKWYCASEAAIAYMIDARNSTNDSDIFQFMELSYSECKKESIKKMVENTFLDTELCINAILEAASKHNVNAYYIVARILQEQGKDGSVLSKGQGYNEQYKGYYNVFNIGASGNGKETVILNGLKKAESKGWKTLESSIIGGTEIIAQSYIARGQNTLYLQKFDVDNSDGNLYWHQYMQNILAAQKEGETLRKTFEKMESIDGEYTFIIPVFKNMPSKTSPRPSTTNTNIPTSTDLVRVNVSGTLSLRDKPKKDANKIGDIYKDEIITRLEKATEVVDGTYWDYVMTGNGTKGYAARETFDYEKTYKLYLVPVNTETPKEPETTIKNDKVKIDTQSNEVTTIPDATVQDFAVLLGKDVVAKNAKGEVLKPDSKLATGCVINDIYTITVLGDVNGDGEEDAIDLLLIKRKLLGTHNLEGCYSCASDLNNDNVIDAIDLLLQKRHLLGTHKIKL